MRSAFNLFVFPNSMFTPFFIRMGYVLSGEIALINNQYYYHKIEIVWLLILKSTWHVIPIPKKIATN